MRINLKKLTSLLLAQILVLGVVGTSVFAVPSYTLKNGEGEGLVPAKEILFSENFDDYTTTPNEFGKTETKLTRNNPAKWEYCCSTYNILWINNVQPSTREKTPYYYLSGTEAFMGKYTIEFKVNKTANHKSGDSTTDNLFFGAGYATDGQATPNFAVKLGINGDDKPYYVTTDESGKEKKVDFLSSFTNQMGYSDWSWNEGTWLNKKCNSNTNYDITKDFAVNNKDWYNVKVAVDTEKATYRVYFNGALVAKDVSFLPAEEGTEWSTRGLNTPFIFEPNVLGGRYVYDDLRIYREVSGYENIYANDFNSYVEATEWNGATKESTLLGVAELGLTVQTGKGHRFTAKSGQLEATTSGDKVSGGFIRDIKADGTMIIEADITVPSFESEGAYAQLLSLTSEAISKGFYYAVDKDGIVYWGQTNLAPNTKTAISTITFDEPHKFVLKVDFVKGTNNLYIDGVLAAKGCSNDAGAYFVNNVGIAVGLGNNIANGVIASPKVSVLYDNLRIYKDEREEAFIAAVDEINTIFTATAYDLKTVTLPTEKNGYNIEWSTEEGSNITIGADKVTAKVKLLSNAAQTVPLTAKVTDKNGEYSIVRTVNVTLPRGPHFGIKGLYGTGTAEDPYYITSDARNTPNGSWFVFITYLSDKKTLKDVRTLTVSDTEKELRIDMNDYEPGTYYARSFIWSGADTMVPICDMEVWVAKSIPEKTSEAETEAN